MLTGLQSAWLWGICAVIFTSSSLCLRLRFYWVKPAAGWLRDLIFEYRLYVTISTSLEKLYLTVGEFFSQCFLHSPSSLPFCKCSRMIILRGKPYLVTTEKPFTVSNFCQDKTPRFKKPLNHHPPVPVFRALPPPQALELLSSFEFSRAFTHSDSFFRSYCKHHFSESFSSTPSWVSFAGLYLSQPHLSSISALLLKHPWRPSSPQRM